MNDGHILIIILSAFTVAQTLAVGIYRYLRAAAQAKATESDLRGFVIAESVKRGLPVRIEIVDGRPEITVQASTDDKA